MNQRSSKKELGCVTHTRNEKVATEVMWYVFYDSDKEHILNECKS